MVRRVVLAAVLAGACASGRATAPRAAGAPAVRYLALGDSFTIGTGSTPAEAFPARLAARWEAAGTAVALRNVGVNGFTTQDLLDVELPAVRPFAPTRVTLAIGANDVVGGVDEAGYRAQVQRIFRALAAEGVAAARVVVLPQPDWSRSPAAGAFGPRDATHARIVRFNDVLREEAARAGARYVDLFALMERQAAAGMLAPDGLHPSAAAHDAWAAALADEIAP